jgi:DNA uptake protein ComE-like DNA-binding protein
MTTPDNYLTPEQISLLEDPTWRRKQIGQKWWALILIFAFGVFVYIYYAFSIKTKKFIIAAGVSSVLLIGTLAFQPTVTEGAVEEAPRAATLTENIYSFFSFTMIAFNVWMFYYLKNDYLVWKAKKATASGSWVEENLRIKSTSVRKPKAKAEPNPTSESDPDSIVGQIEDDADSMLADRSQPVKPAIQESLVAPGKHEEVDIATATLEELAKIDGLTQQQAQKILIERGKRAISSEDELRVILQLKPHEFAKLRGVFAFTRRPGSPGRVLDI